MFLIRIADLTVGIENKYDYVRKLCHDYIVDCDGYAFSVCCSDSEIEDEAKSGYASDYCEAICVYRAICRRLVEYGIIIIHSAVVCVDGEAYVFAAKSGTGKTTHCMLWLKHFGSRAFILNGDKPLFGFKNGRLFAYGTPWCGKENISVNGSAPVKGICFLDRAEQNSIVRIGSDEITSRLFRQVLLPKTEARANSFFSILNKIVDTVPFYRLGCNISDDAVRVAYGGMCRKEAGGLL